MRWAIQVAIDQGFSSVTIHYDAANVVNCLNNKSKFAAIEVVVQDRKELMKRMSNVLVQFVRREHNVEAHNLASLARIVGSRSWLGIAPPVPFHSVNTASLADICNPNGCIPAPF